MKNGMRWVAVVGALLTAGLLFSQVACAQVEKKAKTGEAANAWISGTSINPATQPFSGSEPIITENGTIQKIENVPGVEDALQMTMKGEAGNTWTVFLGPKWFIENQRMKLKAKDKVEVRGKKVGSMIIASEVSKGNFTMILRSEEDGTPTWDCCT